MDVGSACVDIRPSLKTDVLVRIYMFEIVISVNADIVQVLH